MRRDAWWLRATLAVAMLFVAAVVSAQPKLMIGGTTYTKWLWGNMNVDGSVYNFTTVPGEGYGDNGQGSEVELLLNAKVSKQIEVKARLHSRFNQNQWTNYGGWGGSNPPTVQCIGGDCGEFDPRSNQYVKLRGVAVTVTPGYKWIDSATIGANDFGQFDPFVIGRIRYIDRDNASGLLFQGSAAGRKVTWDVTRISLPRLWAGPNYTTGNYTGADAAYGGQMKITPSSMFDIGGIVDYVNDMEVDARDHNLDNGQQTLTRFRNTVAGVKLGIHPTSSIDIRAAAYHSWVDSRPIAGAPGSFGAEAGYSSVIAGKHDDGSYKVNLDFNDIAPGFSIFVEGFDIGADYASMMASRRETDVLLTEGHDGAWAFPGPSNASFGVFAGNPTRIGYGGWDGTMQQVPTINVDNEFTDFDEPAAETVIGWKGVTVVPKWSVGALDLSAEATYITYNTNWQAFGEPSLSLNNNPYPTMEGDTGVGHNFRSAYAPFQDKKTKMAVLNGKYVIDAGKGVDLFGKIKFIKETDNRLNSTRFLPYLPGDCPGGGQACANNKNFYSPGNSVADLYGNPPVITVNGVTGYQWKPFDSLSDDDRDLDYKTFMLGAGYQLTDELYSSISYQYYDVDLKDGNTAFQAYQLHEMASGKSKKNMLSLKARYIIGGAEFGFEYQYNFGTYTPDFGGGFVPQIATAQIAADHGVPVGSLGFAGRYGGWNSLEKRTFDQQRIKAFMKVQF
ncbi:MAG: hypothetical protein ACM3OB_06340 [Acidobacteriota bacterium]